MNTKSQSLSPQPYLQSLFFNPKHTLVKIGLFLCFVFIIEPFSMPLSAQLFKRKKSSYKLAYERAKQQMALQESQENIAQNESDLYVIQNQWLDVGPFSEGLACVKDANGRWGFIDKLSEIIIPCQWVYVGDFSESLTRVKDANGKWGYINKSGEIVISCQWMDARDFSEGLARVEDANGRWGFIDKLGKMVIPNQWKDVGNFSEGLACVEDANGRWGFIDKLGNYVIPCQWLGASSFSEDLAWVTDYNKERGVINKSGQLVIPCQWKNVGNFPEKYSEGLARVEDANGKWGFIDKLGKMVIPGQWKDVGNFSEGLARVEDAYGRWGFIDKLGNNVIPCKWGLVSYFQEGLAWVEDFSGGNRGFIDKMGKKIIQSPNSWINYSFSSEGMIEVGSRGKRGFISNPLYINYIATILTDNARDSDSLCQFPITRGLKSDSIYAYNIKTESTIELNDEKDRIKEIVFNVEDKSTPENTSPLSAISSTSTTTTQEQTYQAFSVPPPAKTQRCIALVIGNADYETGRLSNPVNDAKALKTEFESLGIETIMAPNCSLEEMEDKVASFTNQAKDYDVALFYFSGHAQQLDGENYLFPIGHLPNRAALKSKCIPLSWVIRSMLDSGVKSNVLILDACRDNPYAHLWYASDHGVSPEGLADINNLPQGIFLAFATQAGKTADDGFDKGHKNSPYAAALLEALKKPQSIDAIFKQVKNTVRRNTKGKQVPFHFNNLDESEGDLYLNTK